MIDRSRGRRRVAGRGDARVEVARDPLGPPKRREAIEIGVTEVAHGVAVERVVDGVKIYVKDLVGRHEEDALPADDLT